MCWRSATEATGPGAAASRDRLAHERVRITPLEPAAWMTLGEQAVDRGRVGEARDAFERAVALNPDAPESRLRLVDLALRAGARAEAADRLTRDLSAPLFAAAVSAPVARARLAAGDLEGALPPARRAYAEAAVGQADLLPGNPEYEVRRLFLLRFAADLAPDWLEAQAQAAAALTDRDRFAEAEPYAARVRRLAPHDVNLDIARAVDALTRGGYAAARGILADVVRRNPAAAAGWFYLGQAAMAQQDRLAAIAAFDRFLALAPTAPAAADVRKLVESLRAPR